MATVAQLFNTFQRRPPPVWFIPATAIQAPAVVSMRPSLDAYCALYGWYVRQRTTRANGGNPVAGLDVDDPTTYNIPIRPVDFQAQLLMMCTDLCWDVHEPEYIDVAALPAAALPNTRPTLQANHQLLPVHVIVFILKVLSKPACQENQRGWLTMMRQCGKQVGIDDFTISHDLFQNLTALESTVVDIRRIGPHYTEMQASSNAYFRDAVARVKAIPTILSTYFALRQAYPDMYVHTEIPVNEREAVTAALNLISTDPWAFHPLAKTERADSRGLTNAAWPSVRQCVHTMAQYIPGIRTMRDYTYGSMDTGISMVSEDDIKVSYAEYHQRRALKTLAWSLSTDEVQEYTDEIKGEFIGGSMQTRVATGKAGSLVSAITAGNVPIIRPLARNPDLTTPLTRLVEKRHEMILADPSAAVDGMLEKVLPREVFDAGKTLSKVSVAAELAKLMHR